MKPGLISTIIPVYNRPGALREAVASVLEQDWPSVEVIIVDDGSTDTTAQVAGELAAADSLRVRCLRQQNGGPGAAREAGRQVAVGEFVQYLDSDDVLLPGKFANQVRALRSNPECDVAYGKTRFRHADGQIEPGPWKESGVKRDAMFPSMLAQRWWDTPNPLYRKSICDRAGPWTGLRLEEDWEYDCRIASLGTRLVWCDAFVCEVRDHGQPRLSRGKALDADRLRERAKAHALIRAHAAAGGIARETPEMRRFARALFLLARQCGAAGLEVESRELFETAREASDARSARGLDYRVYGTLAGLVGWRTAGQASMWFDRLRG